MDHFAYANGRLVCEGLDVADLAERFGTPLYIYSASTFRDHYRRIAQAFAPLQPLICYSVKACPNVHICRLLASVGSGFDVVSGGELHRALRAGADPQRIVFAGVGKSDQELRQALEAEVGLINVESESELERLADLSGSAPVRPFVALRINLDLDAGAHRHTTTGTAGTKFGVTEEQAMRLFARYGRDDALRLRGLHVHIGSPVRDPQVYAAATERLAALAERLGADGWRVEVLDLGGGFGAYYSGDDAPGPDEYARRVLPLLAGTGLRVVLEPGRAIAANAGILVTRVLHTKENRTTRFVIVDASMNELIRPALYGAYHFIWPVLAGTHVPPHRRREQPFDDLATTDVVGPICENADALARRRALPRVNRGELLAVFTAGAYAMSMAAQYNSRPRAAEVLVDGEQTRLIRRRETYDDLLAAECEADIG